MAFEGKGNLATYLYIIYKDRDVTFFEVDPF